MPLFFVCSGMCWKSSKTVLQNAKRVLLPYLIYGGIGEFINIIILIVKHQFVFKESIIDILKFLLGMNMYNYPLWFLVAFFVCKVIYDAIMKMELKPILVDIIILLLFISGFLLGYVKNYFVFFFPYRFDIGMVMLIFMRIGNRISIVEFKKKRLALLAVIVSLSLNILMFKLNTLVSVNSSDYGNLLWFLLGSISGSIFVISLSKLIESIKPAKRFLSLFGKQSQIIMCTHAIILLFIDKVVMTVIGKFASKTICNIIIFLLCLIVCFLLIYILNSKNKNIKLLTRKTYKT